MFGKPQWFRPKVIGWGITPATWQGWGYTGLWTTAIAVPFVLLLSRQQPIEAMIWMTLGLGGLAYDVRQILRGMKPTVTTTAAAPTPPARKDDNVLYIMDDGQTHPRVATRGYNLQPR